jgi:hypothetical protein
MHVHVTPCMGRPTEMWTLLNAESNTDNTVRHGQLFIVQCNGIVIMFIIQFAEQSNATHSA